MNISDLKVGLFIPCYIDQFYPNVAIATMQLLEKYGCQVDYPLDQTCCGQPFTNAGYGKFTDTLGAGYLKNFHSFDYVVCPSGSCVNYVKSHMSIPGDGDQGNQLKSRTIELATFLHDVIKTEKFEQPFRYRVGLHNSCHGLRGLRSAKSSELRLPDFNKTRDLLSMIPELEIQSLDREDECCGFGGTFAVGEEAISVRMGEDRIQDHEKHQVEVITGNDMSCLMHLEGLINRKRSKVKIMHVAEILNQAKS